MFRSKTSMSVVDRDRALEVTLKFALYPALLAVLLVGSVSSFTVRGLSLTAPAGAQAGLKPIPAPKDVAAPPADAVKTASGLASKVLTPSKGTDHPTAESTVTVHYTGWTIDGKMFDSSRQSGPPATFALNRVIKGWTEGVQLMVVGEQRRFWIPVELAYNNRAGRPQGMLVFDVELLQIQSPPGDTPP